MKDLEALLGVGCGYGPAPQPLSRQTVRSLLALLNVDASASAAHRQRAMHLLGRAGEAEAVLPIRELLSRVDALERIVAVDALGRIGTPEAIEAVIAHAHDADADVRRFVVTALGRARSSTAREVLQRMADNDQVDIVRAKARRCLERG